MLRNYLLVAVRLIVKNKVFSLINVMGLAAGIAVCILIALFVQDEFNYERGFSEAKNIFRINTLWRSDGTEVRSGHTSPPIARDLADALPEIDAATRVARSMGVEQHIVSYGTKTFFERKALLVDSTFLDLFPFELVSGNPETALDAPASVLISEKLAHKIFGPEEALDESIIINSGSSADTFRITGVVATPRYPSHLDADIYMTMNSNGYGQWILSQTTWANNNMVGSYVRLRDPASAEAVTATMNAMLEERAGEELRMSGRYKRLELQNLSLVRLYSGDMGSVSFAPSFGGNITYIYIIATIGAFILILACINFMNLTTAKSAQRAGEVGIRKSMGAYRNNLISQFLGESIVIVVFSVFVAFALAGFVLPVFNTIMEKDLRLGADNAGFILLFTAAIAIVTGLLAGSYPAFFLSGMNPVKVLKGKTLSGDGSQWLRKTLVVAQFVITITLISSIVIIREQLNYIQSKSLGFDSKEVVMVPMRSQASSVHYTRLKEQFQNIPGIRQISATSSMPSTPLFRDWMLHKPGMPSDQALRHEIVTVDEKYFEVLGVSRISGRDFDAAQDNLEVDTIGPTKVIVNEASIKAMQIPLEDAIGQTLLFSIDGETRTYEIIGVVKDFHQFSLHREIGPMLFMLPSDRDYFPYMAVSVDMNAWQGTSAQMKTIWETHVDGLPFETVFLSDNVHAMYKGEAKVSTLLTISTIVALVISCLGLYGLSVYVAERKTKEIGIRKVVGASSRSIITMLSREYIRLIIISFLISVPAGYYAMEYWLEGFAYRISPGISVFFISGLISFAIAWLTISFESFRAANRNPVETLRNS